MWIVDRIEHLHGAPFQDRPGAAPRGLSWSDCAVLFRSVARDSGPLVDETAPTQHPLRRQGPHKLFDSPEIQAVVGIFRFVVREIDGVTLRSLWDAAQLIPTGGDWEKARQLLESGRDFDAGRRHAVYNIQRLYLDFLDALEMRERRFLGT